MAAPDVQLQAHVAGESLVAAATFPRPPARVQAHVGAQVDSAAEAALAHGARVGLLPAVHGVVPFKTALRLERRPAGGALELGGPFVAAHVDAALDSGGERLEADGAAIELPFGDAGAFPPVSAGPRRLVAALVRPLVRIQRRQIRESAAAQIARMRFELVQARVRGLLAEKHSTVRAKQLAGRVAISVPFAAMKRCVPKDLLTQTVFF